MPTILLIRHGINDLVGKKLAGRMPGVHLNGKGRQQAETLAERLAGAPLRAIYSSPLERATETAAPLAARLQLPVQIRDGLMEIDFGTWEGKTMKQMHRMKLWGTVRDRPDEMTFPGGESFARAQERMVRAIEAIAAGHEEKDVVACVSHSDAIKLAVAHFLGMPLRAFQRIGIDTASVTVLVIDKDGRPFLGAINHPGMLEWPKEAAQPKK